MRFGQLRRSHEPAVDVLNDFFERLLCEKEDKSVT